MPSLPARSDVGGLSRGREWPQELNHRAQGLMRQFATPGCSPGGASGALRFGGRNGSESAGAYLLTAPRVNFLRQLTNLDGHAKTSTAPCCRCCPFWQGDASSEWSVINEARPQPTEEGEEARQTAQGAGRQAECMPAAPTVSASARQNTLVSGSRRYNGAGQGSSRRYAR